MFDLERYLGLGGPKGARLSNQPYSLYVIGCPPSFFKIGIARDVSQRLTTLQTGNPNTLTIVREYRLDTEFEARLAERAAHLFLSEYRCVREWFDCPEDVVCSITEQTALHAPRAADEKLMPDDFDIKWYIEQCSTDPAFKARERELAVKRSARFEEYRAANRLAKRKPG